LDRDSIRGWHQDGSLDTLARAKSQVQQLLDQYEVPSLPQDKVKELCELVKHQALEAGLDTLPILDQYTQ
jgi:trimethylamine:corrinoid methyltransferase-like protein